MGKPIVVQFYADIDESSDKAAAKEISYEKLREFPEELTLL